MLRSQLPKILRRWTSGVPGLSWLEPKQTSPPRQERRSAPRTAARFDAIVHVKDDGPVVSAEGLDFNKYGAMVVTRQPMVPGAVVFFHSLSHKVMGFATVRYCASASRGGKFRVGLEFPLELMYADAGVWDISRVRAAS